MDWTAAIESNRAALKQVLAGLVAMTGMALPDRPATLPRYLHRTVLRLLRPAEAAARRLVIIAARGLAVAVQPVRRRKKTARHTPPGSAVGIAEPANPPCLPLFDPPSRWGRRQTSLPPCVPRISFPGVTRMSPVRSAPMPFDLLDTACLALRLQALGHTLDDLPRHARRFARWRAARDAAAAQKADRDTSCIQSGSAAQVAAGRRVWPLRPGRPPGRLGRSGPAHEIHAILDVLNGLALWTLEKPDTS